MKFSRAKNVVKGVSIAQITSIFISRMKKELPIYRTYLISRFVVLARLKRPPAAFLLNGAITRPATGTITFGQPFPSYIKSFIKIRGVVLEKNANKAMTLCNFNKDIK